MIFKRLLKEESTNDLVRLVQSLRKYTVRFPMPMRCFQSLLLARHDLVCLVVVKGKMLL